MLLKDVRINFRNALSSHYPETEVNTFFEWLCEAYLGYSRFQVSQNLNTQISSEILATFLNATKRLQDFEPIQYIIGQTEFFGLHFMVDAFTLIPRSETEELVEWVLTTIDNKDSNSNILDIGTGSGCIAISLAKELGEAKVSAVDVSKGALSKAHENSAFNGVAVSFFEMDILNTTALPQKYDVIVSNPPYVRELEKKEMQDNVLLYEPDGALYVSDDDPLLFYRKIATLAKSFLNSGGFLFFEINEYLGDQMFTLLEAQKFQQIEIKKDIYGKDRMVRCSV